MAVSALAPRLDDSDPARRFRDRRRSDRHPIGHRRFDWRPAIAARVCTAASDSALPPRRRTSSRAIGGEAIRINIRHAARGDRRGRDFNHRLRFGVRLSHWRPQTALFPCRQHRPTSTGYRCSSAPAREFWRLALPQLLDGCGSSGFSAAVSVLAVTSAGGGAGGSAGGAVKSGGGIFGAACESRFARRFARRLRSVDHANARLTDASSDTIGRRIVAAIFGAVDHRDVDVVRISAGAGDDFHGRRIAQQQQMRQQATIPRICAADAIGPNWCESSRPA